MSPAAGQSRMELPALLGDFQPRRSFTLRCLEGQIPSAEKCLIGVARLCETSLCATHQQGKKENYTFQYKHLSPNHVRATPCCRAQCTGNNLAETRLRSEQWPTLSQVFFR